MKALLLIALAACAGEAPDIKSRAEAVVSVDRNQRGDTAAAKAVILGAFRLISDRELAPQALKTYDTRTLEVLFEAVTIAAENGPRPELLKTLEDIFDECIGRGFVGNMIDGLYARYVGQREWKKARALSERFPQKPRRTPIIVEPADARPDVPAVFTVSGDGKTLAYKTVDLAGPLIVSVVSPNCHFSQDMVKFIEADPRLARLFREHALNIEPAPFGVDAEELARLNREEGFRYEVLYRESGWKGFSFSSTPRFYFVKGGRIVHEVGKIYPSELKEKLAEGLAKIGLKP